MRVTLRRYLSNWAYEKCSLRCRFVLWAAFLAVYLILLNAGWKGAVVVVVARSIIEMGWLNALVSGFSMLLEIFVVLSVEIVKSGYGDLMCSEVQSIMVVIKIGGMGSFGKTVTYVKNGLGMLSLR